MNPDFELVSLVTFSSISGIFMANIVVNIIQTFLSISKLTKLYNQRKFKIPLSKYNI